MVETIIGEGKKSGHGHAALPLFTKLPAELRLEIYREVFSGSQATIEGAPSCSSKLFLKPTDHNQLLFTCHQVYKEACPTYWSKTAVRIRPGSLLDSNDQEQFLGVIPSHARSLIEELQGRMVGRRAEMGLDEFFSHFKRLRTIRLNDTFDIIDSVPECAGGNSECYQDLIATARCAAGPSGYGFHIETESLKVAVLQKTTYLEICTDTLMDIFINHTNGMLFETKNGCVKDEESFQEVL